MAKTLEQYLRELEQVCTWIGEGSIIARDDAIDALPNLLRIVREILAALPESQGGVLFRQDIAEIAEKIINED
jgi:hypothetical protein